MVEYSCHSVVINHLATSARETVHQLLLNLVTVSALTSRNVWQDYITQEEYSQMDSAAWNPLHSQRTREWEAYFYYSFFIFPASWSRDVIFIIMK